MKLLPPSSTELPAFNPILSPAAVTQILLLANPHKVPGHMTNPGGLRRSGVLTDVNADVMLVFLPPPHFTGEGPFALQADL